MFSREFIPSLWHQNPLGNLSYKCLLFSKAHSATVIGKWCIYTTSVLVPRKSRQSANKLINIAHNDSYRFTMISRVLVWRLYIFIYIHTTPSSYILMCFKWVYRVFIWQSGDSGRWTVKYTFTHFLYMQTRGRNNSKQCNPWFLKLSLTICKLSFSILGLNPLLLLSHTVCEKHPL